MARTVDELGRAMRRERLLDAAQQLVETKGYESMSIQDVLDATSTSKGAFYHYFGSKQDLLEGVAERMADAIASHLSPVANDSNLPALDKLQRFFAALAHWKAKRRKLLVALVTVWCSDANALLRQKLRSGISNRIAPLLAQIIQQGVDESVFTASDPEQAGRVVVSLIQDFNDALAGLFLAFDPGTSDLSAVERTLAAYTEGLERILGVPPKSVTLVEMDVLRAWFQPSSHNPKGKS